MAFQTKKGRPRKEPIGKDLGTKELQLKVKKNITKHPLDIMLDKSLISAQQHSASLRLRWLYFLLYGAFSLRAYDISFLGGNFANQNNLWLKHKENLYNQALTKLKEINVLNEILNISIFDITPQILLIKYPPNNFMQAKAQAKQAMQELSIIRNGLDILMKLFCHSSNKKHDFKVTDGEKLCQNIK
jgi:hypothetical protein